MTREGSFGLFVETSFRIQLTDLRGHLRQLGLLAHAFALYQAVRMLAGLLYAVKMAQKSDTLAIHDLLRGQLQQMGLH
jgi:hypothetical protein